MVYPTALELLEFFGIEPERSDDVGLFRVSDPSGVSLEFSFHLADGSVQTGLHVAGDCLCVVSHEGMTRFSIEQDTLRVEFGFSDNFTALTLVTRPRIRVNWSSLRTS
jgi:hypothetical protein